jgi:hypothetical protein
MTPDRFETTFVLGIDRATAWSRLTEHPVESSATAARYWLPGFDSAATVIDEVPGSELRATKDDEPCAGTQIVVTLSDHETGTRITVVQSGFGDWMPPRYDVMAVGWRHIVADLQTYLCTGAHARRHFRPWGDLGAEVTPSAGGLRIDNVRADTLAGRLGLRDDDLLVVLAGAPVSNHDDLVTVLRVLDSVPGPVEAEWVRGGALQTAVATAYRLRG